MQRATTKQRYEFIALMLDHIPGNVPRNTTQDMFTRKLLRYGATLGRIAENQCNGYQDYRGNWLTARNARKNASGKR